MSHHKNRCKYVKKKEGKKHLNGEEIKSSSDVDLVAMTLDCPVLSHGTRHNVLSHPIGQIPCDFLGNAILMDSPENTTLSFTRKWC